MRGHRFECETFLAFFEPLKNVQRLLSIEGIYITLKLSLKVIKYEICNIWAQISEGLMASVLS